MFESKAADNPNSVLVSAYDFYHVSQIVLRRGLSL